MHACGNRAQLLARSITFPLLLISSIGLQAQSPSGKESATAAVHRAASVWLATLSDEQRKTAVADYEDRRARRRWSNLPVRASPRGGLRIGDLNAKQRKAAMAVLEATLSPAGMRRVIDCMSGDEVLRRRGRSDLGNEEYYLCILGTPGGAKPWMWQFGGHHLALNATIVGSAITLSPSLTSAQPITFDWDGKTIVQHERERRLVLELVNSLTKEQRAEAVVGQQPRDLAFGPRSRAERPPEVGVLGSALSPDQKKLLLEIVRERVGLLNDALAAPIMARHEKALDRTRFAWFGPVSATEAASFRIRGPSVVIEWSPQRLGGNMLDHIHAIYREPGNDYGQALLTRGG